MLVASKTRFVAQPSLVTIKGAQLLQAPVMLMDQPEELRRTYYLLLVVVRCCTTTSS